MRKTAMIILVIVVGLVLGFGNGFLMSGEYAEDTCSPTLMSDVVECPVCNTLVTGLTYVAKADGNDEVMCDECLEKSGIDYENM